MSPAVLVGYGTVAVLAYAFTVGVMARLFKRSSWCHVRNAAYGPPTFEGPCDLFLGRGPCDCSLWKFCAAIWPASLAIVGTYHVIRICIVGQIVNLVRAGFNFGRPTPESEQPESLG